MLLTVVPLHGPRGRAIEGSPTARADTLVKPEAPGASSPPTAHLTLLQTLKLPTGLWLNFQPPTSLYAELWGYTAPLTVGVIYRPRRGRVGDGSNTRVMGGTDASIRLREL